MIREDAIQILERVERNLKRFRESLERGEKRSGNDLMESSQLLDIVCDSEIKGGE